MASGSGTEFPPLRRPARYITAAVSQQADRKISAQVRVKAPQAGGLKKG